MLLYVVTQFIAARDGLGHDFLDKNPKEFFGALKATLPYMSDFIDQYGTRSLSYVADSLRDKLPEQIMSELEGRDFDQQLVNRAADLAKFARLALRDQREAPPSAKAPEIIPPTPPN